MARLRVQFMPVVDVGYVMESAPHLSEDFQNEQDQNSHAANEQAHVIRASMVLALFAVGYWAFSTYPDRLRLEGQPFDEGAVNELPAAERLLQHVIGNLQDPHMADGWPLDLPLPEFNEVLSDTAISAAGVGTELALVGAGWIMHHELSHIRNGHSGNAADSIDQERHADREATDWILRAPRTRSSRGSRHLMRDWWQRAATLAKLTPTARLGWHSLRRKFVNDLKADTPMADLCHLGGWKSPLTVMTVYQQADESTMRTAPTNREQRRAAAQ